QDVQLLGLRIERRGPGRRQRRELVAEIDHARTQGVQRRRIGAFESETTAPKPLPVGARDGICDGVVLDGTEIPAFQALADRLELGARGGGGEAGVRTLRGGSFAVNRRLE